MPGHSSRIVWGCLLVVYVVWGSTYLAIAYMIETIPPFFGMALRFLAAALMLASFVASRYGLQNLRIDMRRLGGTIVTGLLLLTFGNAVVAAAEQYLPSGIAALLIASVPLWIIIFRTFDRDQPTPSSFVGVLLGLMGLAVISFFGTRDPSRSGIHPLGILLILLAAASWAVGSYYAPRLPMPENPFVSTVYELAASGVSLLVLSLVMDERVNFSAISSKSWFGLVYLVTFGSIGAFTSYVWLLGNASVSLVATYAYVNPIVALLLGWIVGESLSTPLILGSMIVIIGVILVITKEKVPPV